MNKNLTFLQSNIYSLIGLKISAFKTETESKEYDACHFKLNELKIICRTSKITPKKVGQFVTFWKRNGAGPIAPFDETDAVDFFVVNVATKKRLGQFVFPKAILLKKGIISTEIKEGKRAFRVYPVWDSAVNAQAKRTLKWQLEYFYEIDTALHIIRANKLYHLENN